MTPLSIQMTPLCCGNKYHSKPLMIHMMNVFNDVCLSIHCPFSSFIFLLIFRFRTEGVKNIYHSPQTMSSRMLIRRTTRQQAQVKILLSTNCVTDMTDHYFKMTQPITSFHHFEMDFHFRKSKQVNKNDASSYPLLLYLWLRRTLSL